MKFEKNSIVLAVILIFTCTAITSKTKEVQFEPLSAYFIPSNEAIVDLNRVSVDDAASKVRYQKAKIEVENALMLIE